MIQFLNFDPVLIFFSSRPFLGDSNEMAKTEHGIFVKFKNSAKLLSSYLPVSQSRVLRAPGISPYHLVPKHFWTTWSKPEQPHLLPEACSPNGNDKRRQRQRQTERPPPEHSDILERFHAL